MTTSDDSWHIIFGTTSWYSKRSATWWTNGRGRRRRTPSKPSRRSARVSSRSARDETPNPNAWGARASPVASSSPGTVSERYARPKAGRYVVPAVNSSRSSTALTGQTRPASPSWGGRSLEPAACASRARAKQGLSGRSDPLATECPARAPGTLLARVPNRRRNAVYDGGLPMKLKPLGDRLIVQVVEEEETTASGIVLPDTAKEKPQRGKVVAVGDGKLDEDGDRIPVDVSEGDEVLYSKYGGTEIEVEGEDLLVLRESDVLAKVTG